MMRGRQGMDLKDAARLDLDGLTANQKFVSRFHLHRAHSRLHHSLAPASITAASPLSLTSSTGSSPASSSLVGPLLLHLAPAHSHLKLIRMLCKKAGQRNATSPTHCNEFNKSSATNPMNAPQQTRRTATNQFALAHARLQVRERRH